MTEPTSATLKAYHSRYRQLCVAGAAALGREHVSDEDLVAWLRTVKRLEVGASSWRQYRCAVASYIEQSGLASQRELATILRNTPPASLSERTIDKPRTSATKAKRFNDADCDRVIVFALASRSRYAEPLIRFIQASRLTGLRPCEWPSARLERQGDELVLIVANAKQNDLRAHSATRQLIFHKLPMRYERSLTKWLDIVRLAGDSYPSLQSALGSFMHTLTRRAFPKRTDHPTMYSARHEAAARFKAHYIKRDASDAERFEGAAIVAALLGHASDATASSHYGRPTRADRFVHPVPEANPAEVALVRSVLAGRLGSSFGSFRKPGI